MTKAELNHQVAEALGLAHDRVAGEDVVLLRGDVEGSVHQLKRFDPANDAADAERACQLAGLTPVEAMCRGVLHKRAAARGS